MPCYLFTYHAFGSWMPDHPRGYVQRRVGVLPQNLQVANIYRSNANYEEASFTDDIQLAAIETIRTAVGHIACRLHFIATEPTHIHVLVSWKSSRKWPQNRNSLKKAMTFALKRQFGNRPWFSEGASRKRVTDERHFDHLVATYLPSHRGWKWCERKGQFK